MKRIFLTGASSGIGLATARALTAAGHEVWGTARAIERLPRNLANFHPVALTLGDEEGLRTSFAAALAAAGGRFDVLINNAGSGWFGPAAEMPAGELHAQFQELTLSPFLLVQLALPSMRRQEGGLIINVTSLAGRLPLPYSAAYSAAKAALSVLTGALQMEEHQTGGHPVRFIDVQPGDINTNFNQVMSTWQSLKIEDGPAAAAARQVLAVCDESMAASPPPEAVAQRLLRIVQGGSIARVVTVGSFFQARMGPLAVRLLPARLLQWTIRRNFGLKRIKAKG